MNLLNPKVDAYLIDGCGRCAYFATPKCKVHQWKGELEVLRQIVLDSELTEDLKWGVPVYTWQNKNVINISAFRDYSCISFFKGVLLKDPFGLLQKHGESSQSVRTIRFTDTESILQKATIIREYINEAIDLEKNDSKVTFQKNLEPIPDELEQKFSELPAFKHAFYKLTPGKQRGYIIFFSQPKQSETRIARIEKSIQNIMDGIGMNDKYKR
ncbi:MAG: YdeI/OmpD-associated family protein [Saprospiraceae bacterium]|nr:YdeI/OmpD-associated family protein [Saprospiraceae bacterium]